MPCMKVHYYKTKNKKHKNKLGLCSAPKAGVGRSQTHSQFKS